jgi:glycosyltransferase involved in cell wall biosynthesis
MWQRISGDLRFAIVDGIPVYAVPKGSRDGCSEVGIVECRPLRKTVEQFLDGRAPYDVVHVTHSMRMVEAVEAIRDRSIPYVITLTDFFLGCYRITLIKPSGELCSGPDQGRHCEAICELPGLGKGALIRRNQRLRQIFESASEVIACSGFIGEFFARDFPKTKVRVIEHGVDLTRFNPRTRTTEKKQIVFGFVGTLQEAKGVHILAEAFTRAGARNARLEIIGPCYDDAFMRKLKDIARNGSGITIRAPITPKEVPTTLEGFDLFCLPSIWPEPFPLVQQEALAAGLPCLVSDLGNPPRIVREAHCGQVLPPGDIEAWARSIAHIAAHPAILEEWQANIPLPRRQEEETFMYSRLYQHAASQSNS